MKRKRVHIEVRNGWLKSRWSYQGRRYDLALGMPDGTLNRKIAERKATEIEIDTTTENSDSTLNKYRPEQTPQSSGLSIIRVISKIYGA